MTARTKQHHCRRGSSNESKAPKRRRPSQNPHIIVGQDRATRARRPSEGGQAKTRTSLSARIEQREQGAEAKAANKAVKRTATQLSLLETADNTGNACANIVSSYRK